MRTLFISLITLYISQNSFARPLFEDQQTKYYSHKHDILFDYATKEACEGDGMKWNGEDCLTEATDSVEITREGQLYLVKIGTTANHTNTCEFESSNGYFNRKNKLISSQITNDDDYEESNKAKQAVEEIKKIIGNIIPIIPPVKVSIIASTMN